MATHANRDWRCPACGLRPRFDDGIALLAPEISAGDGSDAVYTYQALFDAEGRHFWFQARGALIAWAVTRYFPGAERLLDVGCSSGTVLAFLGASCPGLDLAGGDVLLEWLRYAKHRLPAVELLQLDLRRLPFREEFDLVGAFDVIEHLDDDEGALRQIHAALRPGGGVVLTVPQHPWLWGRSDDYSRHRRRYRRRELVGRVERSGFRVLRVTSFTALLTPALALSCLADRLRSSPYDPHSEVRIGALGNAMASRLMALERWTIRAGADWPVGGSLLLVAARA